MTNVEKLVGKELNLQIDSNKFISVVVLNENTVAYRYEENGQKGEPATAKLEVFAGGIFGGIGRNHRNLYCR